MAGVAIGYQYGPTLIGTGVKTLVQIRPATNSRIVLRELSISFLGTSTTDPQILVSFVRQTSAGTMTSGTWSKLIYLDPETIQGAIARDATGTEPTTGEILYQRLVHPQGSLAFPVGSFNCIGGQRYGVVIDNTGGVNVKASINIAAME
jgi:hypothetical protein